MTNLWPDSSRKKEKNQTNKIKNEKGEVTKDNAEIQRSIRDYCEQLYGNKVGNLERNEQICRKVQSSMTEPGRNRNYEHPNYKHWNWSCDQKSPQKQKPRTGWLHRRILSNIREEIIPIVLKHFQKTAEGVTFPNSLYKATITLIPKPDKNNTKKKTTGQYHWWT